MEGKDKTEAFVMQQAPAPRPKNIRGKVVNCYDLNVRSNPKIDSNIITTIPVGTEVQIYPDQSTDQFYRIRTDSGVKGFCAKDYIAVEQ